MTDVEEIDARAQSQRQTSRSFERDARAFGEVHSDEDAARRFAGTCARHLSKPRSASVGRLPLFVGPIPPASRYSWSLYWIFRGDIRRSSAAFDVEPPVCSSVFKIA